MRVYARAHSRCLGPLLVAVGRSDAKPEDGLRGGVLRVCEADASAERGSTGQQPVLGPSLGSVTAVTAVTGLVRRLPQLPMWAESGGGRVTSGGSYASARPTQRAQRPASGLVVVHRQRQ